MSKNKVDEVLEAVAELGVNCAVGGDPFKSEEENEQAIEQSYDLGVKFAKSQLKTLFTEAMMEELYSELWRQIPGYEGYYEASSLGRIRSVPRQTKSRNGNKINPGRLLKPETSNVGYLRVSLSVIGKQKKESVHRLVAMAFVPNKQRKCCVNHKDLDRKNNKPENLEWATSKENSEHAVENGAIKRGAELHNWNGGQYTDCKCGRKKILKTTKRCIDCHNKFMREEGIRVDEEMRQKQLVKEKVSEMFDGNS